MINSLHLKTALYAYWRYKRQFVCADEVDICLTSADIIVDTGGFLFEIECKISKSDLVQGEKKKNKHKNYLNGNIKYIPNQFFICVPTDLVLTAKEWCEKVNPKYGVLEYLHEKEPNKLYKHRKWEDRIRVAKKAKFLHETPITANQRERISRRLSSARAITFSDLLQRLTNIYGDSNCEYYI